MLYQKLFSSHQRKCILVFFISKIIFILKNRKLFLEPPWRDGLTVRNYLSTYGFIYIKIHLHKSIIILEADLNNSEIILKGGLEAGGRGMQGFNKNINIDKWFYLRTIDKNENIRHCKRIDEKQNLANFYPSALWQSLIKVYYKSEPFLTYRSHHLPGVYSFMKTQFWNFLKLFPQI